MFKKIRDLAASAKRGCEIGVDVSKRIESIRERLQIENEAQELARVYLAAPRELVSK